MKVVSQNQNKNALKTLNHVHLMSFAQVRAQNRIENPATQPTGLNFQFSKNMPPKHDEEDGAAQDIVKND